MASRKGININIPKYNILWRSETVFIFLFFTGRGTSLLTYSYIGELH